MSRLMGWGYSISISDLSEHTLQKKWSDGNDNVYAIGLEKRLSLFWREGETPCGRRFHSEWIVLWIQSWILHCETSWVWNGFEKWSDLNETVWNSLRARRLCWVWEGIGLSFPCVLPRMARLGTSNCQKLYRLRWRLTKGFDLKKTLNPNSERDCFVWIRWIKILNPRILIMKERRLTPWLEPIYVKDRKQRWKAF